MSPLLFKMHIKSKILIFLVVCGLCIGCFSYYQKYYASKILNSPVATAEILTLVKSIPVKDYLNAKDHEMNNSGILRHPVKNGFLLSLHAISYNSSKSKHTSKLHLLELDQDYQLVKHNELNHESCYKFSERYADMGSSALDVRLFNADKKTYMVYSDIVSSSKRDMFIADLIINNDELQIAKVKPLQYLQGGFRDEKNWSPFVYKKDVYFIYKTHPFIILHWDPETNKITEAFEHKESFGEQWGLGEIHGGTPAIYVKDLDAYLTFFQSSIPYRERNKGNANVHSNLLRIYYVGAFIFQAKPPFKLLAYTQMPLSPKDFYKERDVNCHVIFPCGLIEEEDRFLISAGINQIRTEVFSVEKKDLYKQLKYIGAEGGGRIEDRL